MAFHFSELPPLSPVAPAPASMQVEKKEDPRTQMLRKYIGDIIEKARRRQQLGPIEFDTIHYRCEEQYIEPEPGLELLTFDRKIEVITNELKQLGWIVHVSVHVNKGYFVLFFPPIAAPNKPNIPRGWNENHCSISVAENVNQCVKETMARVIQEINSKQHHKLIKITIPVIPVEAFQNLQEMIKTSGRQCHNTVIAESLAMNGHYPFQRLFIVNPKGSIEEFRNCW